MPNPYVEGFIEWKKRNREYVPSLKTKKIGLWERIKNRFNGNLRLEREINALFGIGDDYMEDRYSSKQKEVANNLGIKMEVAEIADEADPYLELRTKTPDRFSTLEWSDNPRE